MWLFIVLVLLFIKEVSWRKLRVTVLNFASGLESEFAIADPSICVFRVWFSKSDVLVDLFRPNETFEHILAKKIIM